MPAERSGATAALEKNSFNKILDFNVLLFFIFACI